MSTPQKQLLQGQGPHEKKAILDQDPGNANFGGVAPPIANGNTADALNKETIESIRNHYVQNMAHIFPDQAYPGNWRSSCHVGYGGVLRKCTNGERPSKLPDPELEGWNQQLGIMNSEFRLRLQMGLFTDHIIKTYGLPVPNGEECLFWNEWEWMQTEKKIPNWKNRYGRIAMKLRDGRFIFWPRSEQGPIWMHPWHYLSAAIIEADLPKNETMGLIHNILSFIRKQRIQGQRIPGTIGNPHA
ncbi:hypothetical protein F4679DRAFT_590487 [Xylaria curta]|nr:hypothetical protein F4679DRAFT_590487 [Xylaria curta]